MSGAEYGLSAFMKKKLVGRYIITDPKICHGQPTFRGTRILVADVLEQVASGIAWESIVEEWRGSITEEAITEAVRVSLESNRSNLSCGDGTAGRARWRKKPTQSLTAQEFRR